MNVLGNQEKILALIQNAGEIAEAGQVEEAVALLVACLRKSGPFAAEKAARCLEKLHHPSIVPLLVELYEWVEDDPKKRDATCDIRRSIVEVLGGTGSAVAADVLRRAAGTVQVMKRGASPEDMALGLRCAAAWALSQVDHESLYMLSMLLFDTEPDIPVSPSERPYAKSSVRKAAARAIGALGDSGGAAVLAVKLRFAEGEVSEVIAECIEAICALRPPFLIEVVDSYLLGANADLSAIAALALAQNMGADVLDLLYGSLEKVPRDAVGEVIIAIASIRSSKTKEVLLELAKSPNSLIRKAAEEGLETFTL